mgnify:FL=1|tara:strand:+ start:1600 stop:2745 length:1146 start_codon:yes stop_codon:yes gene_type:complete
MRKISVVITNRANYARIKYFLLEANKSKKLKIQIILAGSSLVYKYGELERDLKKDGLIISAKAFFLLEGGKEIIQAKSTGLGIIELSSVFEKLNPDLVLTVGDRYETLATAVATTFMNIPLAHIQGGEVSGNLDENVRHAITKLSHYHFATTKQSQNRILKLGEETKRVFLTGCPSMDLINKKNKSIGKNFSKNIYGTGKILNAKSPYIVAVNHPLSTSKGINLKNAKIFLNSLIKREEQIVLFWPNSDAGNDILSKIIRSYRETKKMSNFSFVINISPENYVTLLANAACLVGNSSSFIREGSQLGIPAVIVGERQNNREVGLNVVRSKFDELSINNMIDMQIKKNRFKQQKIYGDGSAGKKIVKILEKITFDINKVITY